MSVKKEILLILSAFIVLTGITVTVVFFSAKSYVAYINLPGGTYSDIRFETEKKICDITKLEQEGRSLVLRLDNGKPGDTELVVSCIHAENEALVDSVYQNVSVSDLGLFFFGSTNDFRGYPFIPGAAALFMFFVAFRMLVRYDKVHKKYPFSYNALIRVSLFLYFNLQGLLLAALCIAGFTLNDRLTAYTTFLLGSLIMSLAVLALLPFILIFAGFIVVSNLALIRHERFRFANILGFLISGLMILGSVAILLSVFINPGFLDLDPVGFSIELSRSIISPIFVYFICVLAATEYRMLKVAHHEPSYDKDFIIILGCGIRQDGTLFPLLQGRVDRAITFYKNQKQATGKEATFIPSGGKGGNEPIPEGEAMKNYLLEQGIPDAQILPETASKNTYENMAFSKKLIDEKQKEAKVIFTTTNYHIFRSGMIAAQAGLHPDGIGSKTKWYFSPNAQIREFIGLLAGKWKVHAAICLILAAVAVAMVLPPMISQAAETTPDKTDITMTVGETTTLKLNGVKKKVTWTTSNKAVATVTGKGKKRLKAIVTAVGPGKSVITGKYKNKKLTCRISVEEPPVAHTYTQISQAEAMQMMAQDDGHVIVDVRREDEYAAGHIPEAILIPNETIGTEMPEQLPDLDQIILIYCRSGNRSKQAAQKLADIGYTHVYEFGGINTWPGAVTSPS